MYSAFPFMKQKVIHTRVTPEVAAQIRRIAERQQVTPSNWIRWAIAEKLGRDQPDPKVVEFGPIPKPGMETPHDLAFEPRPENKLKVEQMKERARLRALGIAVD